jgi:hypothetical protein
LPTPFVKSGYEFVVRFGYDRHIKDKIRQPLQVGFLFARICICHLIQMPDAKRLRDRGFLTNPERGLWRTAT